MKKTEGIGKRTGWKSIYLLIIVVALLCCSCGNIGVVIRSEGDTTTITKNTQTENSQTKDTQKEDSQKKDTQPEDSQKKDSQTKDSQIKDTQTEDTQKEDTQTEDTQENITSEKPPKNTETEKEEPPVTVQSPPFILRRMNFSGKPMDDRIWFSADGTFVDAYMVDSEYSYIAIFGRFAKVKDQKEAIRVIADQVQVSPDSVVARSVRAGGYPALELTYSMGSNENEKYAKDVLVLWDDALHWLHKEIDSNRYEEEKQILDFDYNDLYMIEITEDMLRNMKPGDASPVFADIKYASNNSVFVNDKLLIRGDDEELLKAYNIDPDSANDYEIVDPGEDKFFEYPIYEKGIYRLSYGQPLQYEEYPYEEFTRQLKDYMVQASTGCPADVYFVGDVAIIVEERYMP